MFEDKFHIGLFFYACLGAFFIIYALPFIYIGFSPYHNDPLAYNPTVLSSSLRSSQEYPNPTKVALWFAELRKTRLTLTIFCVVSLIALHLSKIKNVWKRFYCHFILWLNMAVFLVNYIGLVFYLVRN
jgi:hypothetical protein